MAKIVPAVKRLEREPLASPARLKAARERAARRGALAAGAASYLIVLLLLGSGFYLRPYPTELGSIPDATILTHSTLRVRDYKVNAERTRQVEESYPEIWRINLDANSLALQKLNSFIDLMNNSELRNNQQLNQLRQKCADQLGIALDAATVGELAPQRLRALDPPLTLDYLQKQLQLILNNVLGIRHVVYDLSYYQAHMSSGRLALVDQNGAPREDKPGVNSVLVWSSGLRNHLLNQSLPELFPGDGLQPMREAAAELLIQLIGAADLTFQPELTEQSLARLRAQLAAKPTYRTYQRGEIVAEAGKAIDETAREALIQLNENRRATIVTQLIGIMLVAAIVWVAAALYLTYFRSGFQTNATNVMLHASPAILAIAIGQVASMLTSDRMIVELCFPSALVGLLATLAINARAGYLLVLVSSCLFGIASGQQIDFLAFAMFSGFATVLASRRLRERADLIQVAWKIGIVNVLVVEIFTMINEGVWTPKPLYFGIALANALISVGATMFVIRFFERFFGVVTDLRLLELTGLRHPLIMQLEEKAPGSYQHVLNVTKLAEAAANAIGANYLLVRAGALFHDVGKMVKPKYFSENQVTHDDKKMHARLSPYMSVLIIKNHVKEGVELAKRYGLPQAIIDFIPQHHGTGLIRYFYSAAMKRYEESAAAEPVREEDFRYPGPRPQTIETAVVMLADSVEAIAASKFTGGQISEDEIRKLAQAAISDRFSDGQFDECDLTMRHLRDMREAFVKTLMARYHFRVAYPNAPKPPSAKSEVTSSSISVVGPITRAEGAG